jgi:cellulose synthase/poly-beta-1,6-N-acetylglucosamine synthase-like glycosyltransferase
MPEFYFIVTIFFIFATTFFIYGLFRSKARIKKKNDFDAEENTFSIVVAVKNESSNIASLLESMIKLEYSSENFEIIVCDDLSTDNTCEIVSSYFAKIPNLKLLKHSDSSSSGKRSALLKGITSAKYDRILITDGDCIVSVRWLAEMNSYFTKETQFLIGYAPLIIDKGFINGLSCFENLRSFLIIKASFGLNHPVATTARNMGFRKNVFFRERGYETTNHSIGGDDDLLLKNFLDKDYHINLCPSPEASVFSNTNHSFNDYINQKARHVAASKYYSKKSKWLLVAWHLPNLLAQSSFLISPFYPIAIYIFILKNIFDLFLVLNLQKKFNYHFSLFEVVFYQFFYEIFLTINYFTSRFKNFNWK